MAAKPRKRAIAKARKILDKHCKIKNGSLVLGQGYQLRIYHLHGGRK